MKKLLLIALSLITGIIVSFFSLAPTFGYAAQPALTVFQGGTGSTSPSGIVYGDNGTTPRLSTVKIGTGLTFSAGTLSATGGTGASTTLLGDTNTFSGSNTFSNTITGSITGNAGTATKLLTTRAINGVNFDGSAAITIFAASSTLLANNNTFSGTNIFSSAPIFSSLTGVLKGNGASALTVAANGTDFTLITANTCSAGNHVSAITAAGAITCSADTGSGSPFPFTATTFGSSAANATSTLIGFTQGIYALASSTIGDSNRQGGLTVNGGATTTQPVLIINNQYPSDGLVITTSAGVPVFQAGGSTFTIPGSAVSTFTGRTIVQGDFLDVQQNLLTRSGTLIGSQGGVAATTNLVSDIADGGSTIVLKINSLNTLANAGAKLVSVQNNTAEKFSISALGIASTSGLIVSTAAGSGTRCAQFASDGTIGANASACGAGGSASTTLLGDNNTFSGTTIFSNPIKDGTLAGLIAGNAGLTYAISTTSMNASITGLAGTATALAANGTNCSAGNYPLGVDASGNVESCTAAAVGTVTSVTATYPILSTGGATPVLSTAFGTTTAWGMGTNGFVVTGATGIPFTTASSTLNLPNTALANSTISGVALGSTLAALTATNSTLTFTGSYTGTAAQTVGLNLGNANTWTGQQTFNTSAPIFGTMTLGSVLFAGTSGLLTQNNANFFWANGVPGLGLGTTTPERALTISSSTAPQLMLTDASATAGPWNLRSISGNLYFATSSVTTFATSTNYSLELDTNGKVSAFDVLNGWLGVLSPTRYLSLSTGTTTAWTGSTTAPYIPYVVAPFAGTIRNIKCKTDASFLGVNVQVNTTPIAPSYFISSTTVGTVAATSANTFVAGDKISATFGTTTTATTLSDSCTLAVTETP